MPVALRWLLRLGPTNPIAVRLVQNASRRVRHLYVRSAYLAVLIVVLLWSLIINTRAGALSYRELAEAGAASFTYIAYLQIGLICILAPVFMAGAIAQEASPRTWDILLTTPLTPAQIVLGNLFGRLFFILALLFASLPLFALTQYFGGVPGRSIFASYLIAGCAALLVGAIAISLSVSRLVGRRTVFAFYVSVVSFLAVTLAADYMIRQAGLGAAGGRGVTWLTAANPFLALYAMLNPTGYPRAELGSQTGLARWFLEAPVMTWCLGSILLSLALIVASAFTVRLGGLATIGGGGGGEGRAVPWYRRVFGLGARGSDFRPPRSVWTNPIAWREAAARNATLGRMAARWLFIALGGLFGVGLVVVYHQGRIGHLAFQDTLLATVWGELAVISLVAVNMASTAISREREDGTLDLLLTTPMTQGMYIAGKLRGLVAYLLPLLMVPLGTLLIAGLYVLLDGFGRAGGVMVTVTPGNTTVPITAPVVLPEAGLVAAIATIPFVAACVMVGLWVSLDSKGTLGAVVKTVAIVGIAGGVLGLCGWNAAADLPVVGPFLGALTPASLIFALVHPAEAMTATIEAESGLAGARAGLAFGAVVAAAALGVGVVYGFHAQMVRTFDMRVRKLAGAK